MKSISAQDAYQFRVLVERAAKLQVASESLSAQSQLARLQCEQVAQKARDHLISLGLNPNTDDPVTDDMTLDGKPIPIGVVLRNGQPFDEPVESNETAESAAN